MVVDNLTIYSIFATVNYKDNTELSSIFLLAGASAEQADEREC